MKEEIKKLLKGNPNMQRKNLVVLAKAWIKAHDLHEETIAAMEEMDRAMLKLCTDRRVHDANTWSDSGRPQADMGGD